MSAGEVMTYPPNCLDLELEPLGVISRLPGKTGGIGFLDEAQYKFGFPCIDRGELRAHENAPFSQLGVGSERFGGRGGEP